MDLRETVPPAHPSLNCAIESGDDQLFQSLMDENCPLDVADHRGWRPLQVAASKGRLSIVERLLKNADIAIDWRSFKGDTALMIATGNGHVQVCQCLLENGAKPNMTNNKNQSPLHRAVRMWRLDCAKLLLEFGAEVNVVDCDGRTPIFDAAKFGSANILALLIEYGAKVDCVDGKGITPLFEVARSGDIRCIRLIHERLCDNGNSDVDVEDKDGETPLIIAARNGHLDCVQFLLDKGADANRANKDGELALHEATEDGHLGCVKALLPHTSQYALLKACYGSQVTENPDWLPGFLHRVRENLPLNLPNDGVNILHLAVEWESLEVLQHLLESGLHPDHFISICWDLDESFDNYLAVTALGLACHKGNVRLVAALLDHGAQLTLESDEIYSPLECIFTENCRPNLIRFLMARGHEKGDIDDSLVIWVAFKQPHLLRELMVLGCRLNTWNPDIPGGVGDRLVEMATDASDSKLVLPVLVVLVDFAPRHQFVPLCSRLKSICEEDPDTSHEGWRHLDQKLAAPQSLLELSRLKTREAMMMRRGFHLESAVSTLRLPQRLRDYLMFR